MALLAEVAQQHRREIGVAAGGEDRAAVADRPQGAPGEPLLEPEPDRGGDGPDDDGQPARGTAEQDGRAERSMDRRLEPFDMAGGRGRGSAHPTKAPPPKLKKERKKDEAAN